MQIPGHAPTDDQVAYLTRVLASPEQPAGTLPYGELRGFLFAIASAPVLVKPSEWIPEAFGGEGPTLQNLKEAEAVMGAVMACYNDAVRAAKIDGRIDPQEVGIDIDSEASLEEWSRGFVMGHAFVRDAWGVVLKSADEEDRERLQVAIVALTVWADPAHFQQLDGLDDAELEDVLVRSRELLPAALGLMAGVGRQIYEARLAQRGQPEARRRSTTVGRNDPCPCGSGRKYKNCCLRVH